MTMGQISTFPNWTTNPYSNILYLEAQSNGWRISGGTTYQDLMKSITELRKNDVLHIQWTSPFSVGIRSRAEYQKRIEAFVEKVETAKKRGVHVLWTVHNLVAHQTDYFLEEVRLAKELSALADRVVILNSHTPAAVAEHYKLPAEKIRRLTHCSYRGVYPPPLSRQEVADMMGIPEGFLTIGAIGAVRPYKGTGDFLLSASAAARSLGNTAILLAGETSNWAMQQVDHMMPKDVPVFRKHTKLTDVELAQWMSACDIMVLPYQGILNSGSLHLAATFGVPVVLPALPHLVAEYGDEDWITFFEVYEDAEENIASIVSAIKSTVFGLAEKAQQARKFSEKNTPWDMTKNFAEILAEL